MNIFIWKYQTFIFRCIEHKFSLLGIAIIILSVRYAITIMWIGLIVDLIIALSIATYVHNKNTSILENTLSNSNCELTSYTTELIDKISDYYNNTNYTFSFRSKIAPRQFAIGISKNFMGGLYSFPFLSGSSIILLPCTFDDEDLRDQALLAHEFSHCISHDMLQTIKYNQYIFSMLFIILALYYVFIIPNMIFCATLLGFALMIYYIARYSFLTNIETEANADSLKYIYDNYGDTMVNKISYKFLNIRLRQLCHNCSQMHKVQYYSELNQIYELISILDAETRERVSKSVDKLYTETNMVYKEIFYKNKKRDNDKLKLLSTLRVIKRYLKLPGNNVINRQRLALTPLYMILFPIAVSLLVIGYASVFKTIEPYLNGCYFKLSVFFTALGIFSFIILNKYNRTLWNKRKNIQGFIGIG